MRRVVIFLALSLCPLPALARGGPISLYGPFDPRRAPHPVRAGTSTPSISPSEFLTGCGSGRDLKGIVDFTNGRRCAKNFGNAMDSKLTTGGAYLTAETTTSFKGYYRVSANQDAILIRSFVQFDGQGGGPQTPDSARSADMRPNC